VLNFSNGTVMKKVDTMHEKEVTAVSYVEEASISSVVVERVDV
jgi:hypothetical protein